MSAARPEVTGRGMFSIKDFCSWASLGRTAVYQEIGAGRLVAVKVGGKTLVPVTEAETWLASLPRLRTKPEKT